MAKYELVTASEFGKCTVMFEANSKAECRETAENDIRKWMKGYGIKELHLWILCDGTPVEDIYL